MERNKLCDILNIFNLLNDELCCCCCLRVELLLLFGLLFFLLRCEFFEIDELLLFC
jgi:hypothetical protein